MAVTCDGFATFIELQLPGKVMVMDRLRVMVMVSVWVSISPSVIGGMGDRVNSGLTGGTRESRHCVVNYS